MNPIFKAYIEQNPAILSFYDKPVASLDTVPPATRPWDPGLAGSIREYQTFLGASAMVNGDETVIMTGQQSVLFTGPLYTIYKAITAIKLAEKMQAIHKTPCVPLFWIASDDHDFEEAHQTFLLNKLGGITELAYVPTFNFFGSPLHSITLDESLHALVDLAAESATGSEFREEVRAFLHQSLDDSQYFDEWVGRILARLFRDTPLVFFNPSLLPARELAASIITREIQDPVISMQLVNEAGRRLSELGFVPQIIKSQTECGFFLEMGRKRRKIITQNNRFFLPEESLGCTQEDLYNLLEAAPERFSPNVALRCIIQQHLFPAAAYVGGPAEIAYWAQFKQLFEYYALPMPVLYPRSSCLLTNIKLNKLMSKYGFTPDDLTDSMDNLINRAVRHIVKDPALDILQTELTSVEETFTRLADTLSQLKNSQAEQMTRNLALHIQNEKARIERTLLHANTVQMDASKQHVNRLCTAFYPQHKPQERFFTILSFLFEFGWDIVPRLMREITLDSVTTQTIEL